jgi:hypothetical protein
MANGVKQTKDFDIEKARWALLKIAQLASDADTALCGADSGTCAKILDQIEDQIAVVRDNAPGLF